MLVGHAKKIKKNALCVKVIPNIPRNFPKRKLLGKLFSSHVCVVQGIFPNEKKGGQKKENQYNLNFILDGEKSTGSIRRS